jgi:hypothetical protein
MKKVLIGAAIAALLWWAWRRLQEGPGAAGTGPAAGGAGGAGGSATANSGSGAADYAALAAAIQALAAGVQAPAFRTVATAVPAGTTEIVAAEGGRRIRVLAFSVTSAGANNVRWLSGGLPVWQLGLDAPAGSSGANLATAWPGYLWTSDAGANLAIETTAAAQVSVTYWME